MLQVTVNNQTPFTFEGNPFEGADVIQTGPDSYHIIKDNKSYNVTIVQVQDGNKTLTVRVNGNDYEVNIKDKYDLLLQQLGISATSGNTVKNVKAPMPGLIVNLVVSEGSTVQKGDPLLILEAMKMENVLKSPRDGTIRKIAVTLRQAVEKNQLLLEFE